MTTDGRFDESITSWLEASAPSRLPERVLDATFERTRRSDQHVSWRALLGRIHISRFATAIGGTAAVLVVAALAADLARNQPDNADGPGRPDGIFADVGGWIAFGDGRGIWAVDPTRPGDPDSQVQLSSKGGTPEAWSPDGSKLLVLRGDLFVLNADGTETRLTTGLTNATFRSGADFTADGSRVVYSGPSPGGPGIYVIDAEGGTPEFLHAGYAPTLSPDGTQIAYFDGHGDGGHSLRVMNSDGTGERAVVENSTTLGAGHVIEASVDWSPDGEHLLFVLSPFMGVSVVGIDGSGPKELSSDKYIEGVDPHWSPDGSLISYNHVLGTKLVIARWDGTPIQEFDYGRSGPWNPGLRAPERTDPSHEPTPPPTEAPEVTELLNGFLAARVAGEGAEQYVRGDDIPLLYATTSGAPYERAEFEPVGGIDWPYGLTAFKVRLFAGDTVVEQLLFWPDDHDPTALGYVPDGFGTDIAPTTEDGQPVAAPFTALDGEVTLHVTHPWVSFNGSGYIRLIPKGARPTTDGGERNDWDQLVLMADPVGYGTGCTTGPDPADAEALAETIRSDPELEATAPVTVIAGGARGLMMDVLAVGGGAMCGGSLNGSSEVMRLQAGDRMRLYLFDAPEGSSMRILAAAIVVPDSDFERAVESGSPIVSVDFHKP